MSEFHVFGYGSLMYEPACPDALVEVRDGVLTGWARAFDKRSRARGCTDGEAWLQAGLSGWSELGWRVSLCLGLEQRKGATVHGKVLTYRGDAMDRVRATLDTREGVGGRPDDGYVARRLKVQVGEEEVEALAYVTNRKSTLFAGGLAPDETVRVLTHATPRERGLRARGADYLLDAAAVLDKVGVRDEVIDGLAGLARERLAGR